MVSKLVYIVIAVVVVLAVGFFALSGNSNTGNVVLDQESGQANEAPSQEIEEVQEVAEPEEQDVTEEEATSESSLSNTFCNPGDTYVYSGDGGSSESVIIGPETFRGGSFCKAESTTVINSPAGDIMTDTTYYFEETNSEYWVLTTVSSPLMPEPQVTEVHIVDGEIVS